MLNPFELTEQHPYDINLWLAYCDTYEEIGQTEWAKYCKEYLSMLQTCDMPHNNYYTYGYHKVIITIFIFKVERNKYEYVSVAYMTDKQYTTYHITYETLAPEKSFSAVYNYFEKNEFKNFVLRTKEIQDDYMLYTINGMVGQPLGRHIYIYIYIYIYMYTAIYLLVKVKEYTQILLVIR